MVIKINGDQLVWAIKYGHFLREGFFYLCVCGSILYHRRDGVVQDEELGHITGTAHAPWLNGASGSVRVPILWGNEGDPTAAAYQLARQARHRLNSVPLGHPLNDWYPPRGAMYEWGSAKRRRRVVGSRELSAVARVFRLVYRCAGDVLSTVLGFYLAPLEVLAGLIPSMEYSLEARRLVETYEPHSRVVTRTRIRAIEVVHQEVRDE